MEVRSIHLDTVVHTLHRHPPKGDAKAHSTNGLLKAITKKKDCLSLCVSFFLFRDEGRREPPEEAAKGQEATARGND